MLLDNGRQYDIKRIPLGNIVIGKFAPVNSANTIDKALICHYTSRCN